MRPTPCAPAIVSRLSIISIIAGVTLLFSPIWGAVILWWLLGIGAVVFGIINIVRAFSFGKA